MLPGSKRRRPPRAATCSSSTTGRCSSGSATARTRPPSTQLRPRLAEQGVEIVTFDLSHFHGPGECLHLMSFISPLDADLAVVYLPMMPVRLVHLLEARGIAIVEVPEEEFPSLGPNVLALGPRRAITRRREPDHPQPDGGRRRRGPDLSRRPHLPNGDGGPTCLTRAARAGMIGSLGLPPHHVRRAVPAVPRRPDVGDVLARARAARIGRRSSIAPSSRGWPARRCTSPSGCWCSSA